MRNYLSNQRPSLNKHFNRVDPVTALHPPLGIHLPYDNNYMNQHVVEHYPMQGFPFVSPVFSTKKFSQPSHIYKHVYVRSPKKPIIRKKKKCKEESWLDDINPFNEISSESEEHDDE